MRRRPYLFSFRFAQIAVLSLFATTAYSWNWPSPGPAECQAVTVFTRRPLRPSDFSDPSILDVQVHYIPCKKESDSNPLTQVKAWIFQLPSTPEFNQAWAQTNVCNGVAFPLPENVSVNWGNFANDKDAALNFNAQLCEGQSCIAAESLSTLLSFQWNGSSFDLQNSDPQSKLLGAALQGTAFWKNFVSAAWKNDEIPRGSPCQSTSCYVNPNPASPTFPNCWQYVAYGKSGNFSEGYFIIPVGICNDTPNHAVRYFIEPSPSKWFKVQPTVDVDEIKQEWFCDGGALTERLRTMRINWDGSLDGLISSGICLRSPDSVDLTDFVDEPALPPKAGETRPCVLYPPFGPSSKTCPPNGFSVGLLFVKAAVSNGKPWSFQSPDSVIWLGPSSPSQSTLSKLGEAFLKRLSLSPYVPISGAGLSCANQSGWPTFLEAVFLFIEE
jgi:hypothetical protein